jgi:3-oxoacyl-[acyl-carrier-protein] synthase-1
MAPSAASDVEIIGLGARTPLGLASDASAAAVRGALSVIGQHPFFVDKTGEPMMMACDAVLPADLDGTNRYLELARPSLAEALRPLTNRRGATGVITTIVGLPEKRPGRAEDLESVLAADLVETANQLGLSLQVQTISYGHSSGLMALDAAVRRIRAGEIDVCLVGGVDSYIQGETLEWLDQNRQLMSGVNRSGFAPGEAAGFCLVASSIFARRAGVQPVARVVSVFTALEPKRIKTDTICIGEGLAAAIRGACAALDPAAGKVEQTFCDMNGERYRSTEYTYALMRTSRFFAWTRVAHPADCWGDIGAASGPLFACLAVASWSRAYATGPRALLWTSSESGYRAAAVLERATEGGESAT